MQDIPQTLGQLQEPLDISGLETAVRELLPKPWNEIEGRVVDPVSKNPHDELASRRDLSCKAANRVAPFYQCRAEDDWQTAFL